MTPPRFWAVVPAAGIGTRMASDRPKQYLQLHHQTVLEHSVKRLLAMPQICAVFVAIAEHDNYWDRLSLGQNPRVWRVPGGNERADSVLNALQAMADYDGPDLPPADDDWVLVHDAARPCVQPHSIQQLMTELAGESYGGILASPVSDTIKRVGPGYDIEQTVDRATLWQAQTPQMFRLAKLRRALAQALAAGAPITDEASAIEWAGGSAKVVAGPGDNLKITRPEDLPLAEFILQRHHLAE